MSTTRLPHGLQWADRYVLQLPPTAYAPDIVQIEAGLYNTVTGTRLAALGGRNGAPSEITHTPLRFGSIEVQSAPNGLPNPIHIDFGGRLELVGYGLDRRIAAPGEDICVTFYWQGARRMSVDYTVSAQLVGPQQRKAAQLDSWPNGGASPTTAWERGQTVTDQRALTVFSDAAPGAYDLRVAVYSLKDGGIRHLPVVPAGGRMLTDHMILTQVRILPQ